MGLNSGIYKFLFVLHILAVVVGFGPLMLGGAWGVKAKALQGREGAAVAQTTYDVLRTYAEWAIYAVPVFGILLILVSDDAWKFSQTWISLSFLLYLAGVGIAHAAHFKNLKRMNELMAELAAGTSPPGAGRGGPPPQVAELEERGKRAALVGGVLNVIVVAIIFLMVWKPGA
jgi:uncharacterized membrane protein